MTKFDFWKDNKTAAHYEMTVDQFIAKLIPWVYTKELNWLKYYGTQMTVRGFITSNDGLSSVFEEAQFRLIYEASFNTIMNIVDTSIRLHKVLEPIKDKEFKRCSPWEHTIRAAFKSKDDGQEQGFMTIFADLREQYQENPLGVEQVLGFEVAELVKKLPLRKTA